METTTIKLRIEENQRAVECLQSRADSLLTLSRSNDCDHVPGAVNYGALLVHDHLEKVRVAIVSCIQHDLFHGSVWNGQGTSSSNPMLSDNMAIIY